MTFGGAYGFDERALFAAAEGGLDQRPLTQREITKHLEQFGITVKDLSRLTVLLCWHLGLEERDRRSVQIELSGNTLFSLWWFVC